LVLLIVQVVPEGIKIRMKHLAVIGTINGHKVENPKTVRIPMEMWTDILMTSSQILIQVPEDGVIIIIGIDIDIYKKMTSWINVGKNERKLG
jgi:hypothetical protein